MATKKTAEFIRKRAVFALLLAMILGLLLLAAYQQTRIWQLSSCQEASGSSTVELMGKRVKRNSAPEPIEYAMLGPSFSEAGESAAHLSGPEMRTSESIAFPLYAQLSAKALHQFCLKRFASEFGKACGDAAADIGKGKGNLQLEKGSKKKEEEEKGEENSTRVRSGANRRKQFRREKVCRPIHSLGPVQQIGRRVHGTGSAVRRGNRWFLAEYRTGYTLFQFDLPTDNQQNSSSADQHLWKGQQKTAEEEADDDASELGQPLAFPSRIHTLSEPFRGTDHAVGGPAGDETFYYELASGEGRIQALNLRTGRRLTKLVFAEKSPLYGLAPPGEADEAEDSTLLVTAAALSAASFLDLEFDQSALWLLFRQPNHSFSDSSTSPTSRGLSVLKLAPDSLKELGSWHLEWIDPARLVNAFVGCGVLYTVELAKVPSSGEDGPAELRIRPAFDFRMGLRLLHSPIAAGQGWMASGPRSISNVQYDSETDSLAVFDWGKVLVIPLHRKKVQQKTIKF